MIGLAGRSRPPHRFSLYWISDALAALAWAVTVIFQLLEQMIPMLKKAGLLGEANQMESAMNIFLTSSFAEVADLFVSFTRGECKGKTVTLIPTASLAEEVNAYLIAAKDALVKAGLVIDELEVSTASQEDIVDKLERNEYIYVAGGNTFFLLQELKRTGADRLIAEQVRAGKCYIGESAGSAVLAPSIEYLQELDDATAAPDLDSYTSLALIDFYPLPHYKNPPFEDAIEQVLHRYGDNLDLRPFSNNQALAITGSHTELQTSGN